MQTFQFALVHKYALSLGADLFRSGAVGSVPTHTSSTHPWLHRSPLTRSLAQFSLNVENLPICQPSQDDFEALASPLFRALPRPMTTEEIRVKQRECIPRTFSLGLLMSIHFQKYPRMGHFVLFPF
jgi:hypothetical protein